MLVGEARRGAVDAARLEDPHGLRAAGEVELRRVEQRAEQRRAHDRQRLRERVFDRDDVSHRVICREAKAVEERGIGEAPAGDLRQAAGGQRVLEAARQLLGVREATGGAIARGQRRRQAVEAVDPCDLLDQVDRPGDVARAEVGRRDKQTLVVAVDGEFERLRGSRGSGSARCRRRAARSRAAGEARSPPAQVRARRHRSCPAGALRRRARSGASSRLPSPRRSGLARGPSRSAPRPRCAARGAARCAGRSRRSS